MIPLIGYVQGDTLGVLVFAYGSDTPAKLAERTQTCAAVRVVPFDGAVVLHYGIALRGRAPLSARGIQPLDRIDVRRS
jgi:hypothetical protein